MPNSPVAAWILLGLWTPLSAQAPIGGTQSSPAGVISGAAIPVLHFSIEGHGPTIGMLDSGASTPITAGDVLVPAAGAPSLGPLATPTIAESGGVLGLNISTHATCAINPVPGDACPIEVDALSFGLDSVLNAGDPIPGGFLCFSVDEFAKGALDAYAPSVNSEGEQGAKEASADCFLNLDLPAPPVLSSTSGFNVGAFDGDGLMSLTLVAYPGVGLVDFNPPSPPPDVGDNLDALVLGPLGTYPIYFSLDSSYMDPITLVNLSGSATANGFQPGDVLVTVTPGAAPLVYATAAQLGLSSLDDLDALALAENGVAGYQPSLVANDWDSNLGSPTDMLLFSVRRGSPLIGTVDSLQTTPIVAGDILTTPQFPSTVPGIYIAAEALGLIALRNGDPLSDELCALHVGFDATLIKDCNGNGTPDSIDIRLGISSDLNENGVPDRCDLPAFTSYCTSNNNSTGSPAQISASGSASVPANSLVFFAQPVPNNPGIFFYGASQASVPFGAGFLCVQPPLARLNVSFASGNVLMTPFDNTNTQVGFDITPGSTWNFQGWYRDPPLGPGFNTTDGLQITFTP